MSDTPQANPNGLMSIGAVAAHNIAAALNLPEAHVGTIEQAIKDEINAMSSHFTLAVADVQTQYEAEVLKLTREKDDFITAAKAREVVFVKAFQDEVARVKSTLGAKVVAVLENKYKLGAVIAGLVALGVLVGLLK